MKRVILVLAAACGLWVAAAFADINAMNGVAITTASSILGKTPNSAVVGQAIASSGPSYGSDIADFQDTGFAVSFNITLSGGASVGQRAVLRLVFAAPDTQQILTVVDTAGNTWAKDIGVNSDFSFARGEIWSAPVTSALVATNTLTVTFNAAKNNTRVGTVTTINGTSGTIVTGSANGDASPGTTESNPVSTGGAAVCLSISDTAATTTYTVATGFTADFAPVQGAGYTFSAQYETVGSATTVDSGGVWGASARWLNLQAAYR